MGRGRQEFIVGRQEAGGRACEWHAGPSHLNGQHPDQGSIPALSENIPNLGTRAFMCTRRHEHKRHTEQGINTGAHNMPLSFLPVPPFCPPE